MVTDGLQLYYDVNNIKSYPGEPTTNIVTYPDWSNISDHVVGTASRTKESYLDIGDGITIVQATTSDIISVTVSVNDSTPTSGVEQTWSADLYCTSTGSKIKSQIIVYVDGVKNWLQNDGSWTTSVNEYGYMFSPTSANQWHRWSKTITLPVGTLTGLAFGSFYRTTGNFTLKIANVLIEEKSHATQFVNCTRSTTDGLKDLSGQANHADLANAGFDSNALLDFNNSNLNYIPITTLLNAEAIGASTTKTISFWFNPGVLSSYMAFSTGQTGDDRIYMWTSSNLHTWRVGNYTTTSGHSTLTVDTWYYTTLVIDGNNLYVYLNGQLDYSGTYASFTTAHYATLGRHGEAGAYYFNGKIDVVQIYTKALSAQEVLQNYNALKGRYI